MKSIIVFDLDETLGCFAEIGMFWEALNTYFIVSNQKPNFFDIMDLFPEFLRPQILTILKKILVKKKEGKCEKIMIYTNNQGPKIWTQMIADYFEYKLGEKVFDNIIGAFKVNNNIIEVCRTSQNKKLSDILKCAKISSSTRVCFFDDQYHPLMNDKMVYYVNIKPFHYSMPFKAMSSRYGKKYIEQHNRHMFNNEIINYMKNFNYIVEKKTQVEHNIDVDISKQMFLHIDKFFSTNSSRKTKRRHGNYLKQTQKR